MIIALPQWLAKVDLRSTSKAKKQVLLMMPESFYNRCFCFFVPFLFAEFFAVGRVNSPGKANLVLCARTAHPDGLVGNSDEFRHLERFLSGQIRWDGILLVTFLLLLKEK